MFRILSERQIHRACQWRRWQALAIFSAGICCGTLINAMGGWPPAAEAAETRKPRASASCLPERATLRLDCGYSARAPNPAQ